MRKLIANAFGACCYAFLMTVLFHAGNGQTRFLMDILEGDLATDDATAEG